MKTRLAIFSLTLAFMAATATQSQAQSTTFWSMPASGCVVQTGGNTLVSQDAASGTATFAPGKFGDIRLTCPVAPFSGNINDITGPTTLNITYYDDRGFDPGSRVNHCWVQADLLRTNLDNIEHGGDIATVLAANQVSSGRQVQMADLPEDLNFSTSYYWVDIQLHRDAANATCNPTLVGTNLTW